MLQTGLLLIVRNAKRFKATFYINLLGLTAGFACALLIYLWIDDELRFDRYHQHDDRLFQAMYHEKGAQRIATTGQTPYFLADALVQEFPDVEIAVTTTPPMFFPDFTVSADGKVAKAVGKFADREFFQLFSYPLISGDAHQALADDHAVVISETLASKLFGSAYEALGKTIDYEMLHITRQVSVSGVFRDVPLNSSEHFDFILPFDVIRQLLGLQGQAYNWEHTDPFFTYVLLKEGTDLKSFNRKLSAYIAGKNTASPFAVFVRPFSDGYLYGKYENGQLAGGRIGYVRMFGFIAAFVLIIACINFVNLSTAKAGTRLKEIGIRKVVGATRGTLVAQHLGETIVLSVFSLFGALLIVYMLIPEFNLLTGKSLKLSFDAKYTVMFAAAALFTGILAGLYPALYISRFQPARILRGNMAGSPAEAFVRKGLVVFQFTLSIIFIVGVLVVYRQLSFVQSRDLGYRKDNLLYFSADGEISRRASAFLEEIKKIPGVVAASSMFGSLTGEANGLPGSIEYGGKQITMYGVAVNYDMLETLGMKIKLGRSFSRERDHAADTMKWIFNETAAAAIGEEDPVGKIIADREIIGVVKDFHFQTLHEQVKPFAFRLEPYFCMDIWVRVIAGQEKETVDQLKRIYAKFNPGLAFNYKFLDQAFAAQYAAEQRVVALAKYAAALAIGISCMGLYGLASFTAARRKKEIGIRKAFGATAMRIVLMLSSGYTRMVMVAMLIAVPLSYVFAREWLNAFAYNTGLPWWYFAGGGMMALVIAWITVGVLTFRAAWANPVDSLRHE